MKNTSLLLWFTAVLLTPFHVHGQDVVKEPLVRFEMQKRPSVRIGKIFRLDLRVKAQADFRAFSPHVETDEGTFDFHRGRVGIEGDLTKSFEYEFERDFRQSLGARDQRFPWKDAYVNFRHFDRFQLKVGKFKVPFGMEELTSEQDLDVVLRSRISDDLTPGRDIGAMFHGRFFKRGLNYEAGVFRHDGENARPNNGAPSAGRTLAGRVTTTPLRRFAGAGEFRTLEVGAAFTRSDVAEGLGGVRGHTASDDVFFHYVDVKGPRTRTGLEATWASGPFSVKGEFIRLYEAREGQGIFNDDLPAKISHGWYTTATWILTGEKKDGNVDPRRAFLKGGPGAIEVAARYEQVRFSSADYAGQGFSSPRSVNLLPQTDHVLTLGTNWFVNHYVKVQLNGVHETVGDAWRSPLPGRSHFWMGILRIQFVM